jgi:nucleoside-diphosphate-sugar epimerase
VHVQDVARVFLHALSKFDLMKGKAYNVGLDDANLSKLELCAEIKQQVPAFVYMEAPVGEDPDKRDYIVSNARLVSTGFVPEWSIGRGIAELIKGYAILRNNQYSNV